MVALCQPYSRANISGSRVNGINKFARFGFAGHIQFLSKPSGRLIFKGQNHVAIAIYYEKTATGLHEGLL